jgi:hypothetical protein
VPKKDTALYIFDVVRIKLHQALIHASQLCNERIGGDLGFKPDQFTITSIAH